MDIMVRNLDIVFRRIQPEMIYTHVFQTWDKFAPAESVFEALFNDVASVNYPTKSREELCGVYRIARDTMKNKGGKSSATIYGLILDAGDKLLETSGDELLCKFDSVLTWQEVYLLLGQDLFTTAKYAFYDMLNGDERNNFLWEPVLRSNYRALNNKLEQGLAENHFHLNGSSQNFAIMWAYLMNHPRDIHYIDNKLVKNLQPIQLRSVAESRWTWGERLIVAAWIRACLFERIHNVKSESKEERLDDMFFISRETIKNVDRLRYIYGMLIDQPNGNQIVLDYAMDQTQFDDLKHTNRILAGERGFMYECFYNIFSDKWSNYEVVLFYIYLLIKANYRSEIIQTNKEYGFTNFKEYQDRKVWFFGEDSAYYREMIRIAIRGNMENYPIKTLEARFAPALTANGFRRKITDYDLWADMGGAPLNRYYYVAHFIKEPDLNDSYNGSSFYIPCRNYKSRVLAAKGARAMQEELSRNSYVRSRLIGIDAASTELACRPEVFAEAYRMLRDYKVMHKYELIREEEYQNKGFTRSLGVTYHAGEDFFDILDGLRAIDEAVRFLKLKRGDRIGHALALGVQPEMHYERKNMQSVLTKQDHLDNLVWALHMTVEFNIPLGDAQRRCMQEEAEQLIHEIYGSALSNEHMNHVSLSEYYRSWRLRQDPPEWYEKMAFSMPLGLDEKMISFEEGIEHCRQDKMAAYLYACYHYSGVVRKKGGEFITVPISKSYMQTVRKLQDKMQEKLSEAGILIECNSTSNYLIGTFRDYTQHPIFRFFPVVRSIGKNCLQVSINTDDLGVFDTSLENEYTIIAAAMHQMTNEDGNRLYSDETIEEYIESIRKNGLNQAFQQGNTSTVKNYAQKGCQTSVNGLTES